MTVFDWLQGVALPSGVSPFDAVEVRFKANRKAFFRKPETSGNPRSPARFSHRCRPSRVSGPAREERR